VSQRSDAIYKWLVKHVLEPLERRFPPPRNPWICPVCDKPYLPDFDRKIDWPKELRNAAVGTVVSLTMFALALLVLAVLFHVVGHLPVGVPSEVLR
jgi:hypothetical protein